MKKFDLPADARVKLTKATPRKEIHGDERVQAISLRLRWETTNENLALLHPNLKDMLFFRAAPTDAQGDIPDVPQITPNLRVPSVSLPLKLADASFTGYTLKIDHGIDDSSALELYLCSLDKFTVDAKEGGSAVIEWSMGSNKEVTPELVGALCELEGDEIIVNLTPPSTTSGPAIDGTKDLPGFGEGTAFADNEDDDGPIFGDLDATDAFVNQHTAAEDDDGADDSDQAEESVDEPAPRSRRGRRTAGAGAVE